MIDKSIVANVLVMRGDDIVRQYPAILDVTEVLVGGEAEIAFSDRKDRVFIRFDSTELFSAIMKMEQTE